ncbi:hypothetical protein [Sediminibacillus terrae]|uniref:hypothetical protein n=1 Tax=Sediminibacillus terrae TaxID=1562106 RepID=UPI0012969B32|nr:hypothetical protein [Sediminibacillus terrae]
MKDYYEICSRFVNQRLDELKEEDRKDYRKLNKQIKMDFEKLSHRIKKNKLLCMRYKDVVKMLMESIEFRLKAVNILIDSLSEGERDLDKSTFINSNQKAHDLENKLGAYLKGEVLGKQKTR